MVEVQDDKYTGEVSDSRKQVFKADSCSRVFDDGSPGTNRKRYRHNNDNCGAKDAKHDAELSALLLETPLEVLIHNRD